jgi:hypothetical protein
MAESLFMMVVPRSTYGKLRVLADEQGISVDELLGGLAEECTEIGAPWELAEEVAVLRAHIGAIGKYLEAVATMPAPPRSIILKLAAGLRTLANPDTLLRRTQHPDDDWEPFWRPHDDQ